MPRLLFLIDCLCVGVGLICLSNQQLFAIVDHNGHFFVNYCSFLCSLFGFHLFISLFFISFCSLFLCSLFLCFSLVHCFFVPLISLFPLFLCSAIVCFRRSAPPLPPLYCAFPQRGSLQCRKRHTTPCRLRRQTPVFAKSKHRFACAVANGLSFPPSHGRSPHASASSSDSSLCRYSSATRSGWQSAKCRNGQCMCSIS